MKKEIVFLSMILTLLFVPLNKYAFAAEVAAVCVKEYDNKLKKEKEVCKTIIVHKKLEGTKIPDKK